LLFEFKVNVPFFITFLSENSLGNKLLLIAFLFIFEFNFKLSLCSSVYCNTLLLYNVFLFLPSFPFTIPVLELFLVDGNIKRFVVLDLILELFLSTSIVCKELIGLKFVLLNFIC
jgi:hypothetical protein